MKKEAKKRLFVKKVTIANLNQDELNIIRGGCMSKAGCPKQLDTRDTVVKSDTDTC
jgi:hypothetical protein